MHGPTNEPGQVHTFRHATHPHVSGLRDFHRNLNLASHLVPRLTDSESTDESDESSLFNQQALQKDATMVSLGRRAQRARRAERGVRTECGEEGGQVRRVWQSGSGRMDGCGSTSTARAISTRLGLGTAIRAYTTILGRRRCATTTVREGTGMWIELERSGRRGMLACRRWDRGGRQERQRETAPEHACVLLCSPSPLYSPSCASSFSSSPASSLAYRLGRPICARFRSANSLPNSRSHITPSRYTFPPRQCADAQNTFEATTATFCRRRIRDPTPLDCHPLPSTSACASHSPPLCCRSALPSALLYHSPLRSLSLSLSRCPDNKAPTLTPALAEDVHHQAEARQEGAPEPPHPPVVPSQD